MTFPEDPRGLTRDELVRLPYGRRKRARTRAEFVHALASGGLLQTPGPPRRALQSPGAAAAQFLRTPPDARSIVIEFTAQPLHEAPHDPRGGRP